MSRGKTRFSQIIFQRKPRLRGRYTCARSQTVYTIHCFPRSSRVRKNHPASRMVMEAPAEAPT